METHAVNDANDVRAMLQEFALGEGPFVIGGRSFRNPESKTVAQDAWIEKRYRFSGLAEMARTAGASDESIEDLAERLLLDSIESGVGLELLAGMLVEDGTTWTRERAQANAEFFARLTARADRDLVYRSLSSLLFRFLTVAAVSKLISQSSSRPRSETLGSQPGGDAHDDSATGATSTTSATLGNPEE